MEFLTRASGVVVVKDVLEKIPDRDLPLVEKYIDILDAAQPFYRTQKEKGFYPDLNPSEKLPEGALSPYSLVRRLDGRLVVNSYIEVSPYRQILANIADKMDEAVEMAKSQEAPQNLLIEDVLGSQARYLREGDFRQEMVARLNSYDTPDIEVGWWLLDRYLDRTYGAKLSGQGWIICRNGDLSRKLNEIASQVATSVRTSRYPFQVVAGDVLAYGGLSSDRRWSANALPSEDDLRTEIRAVGFMFLNRARARIEETIKPALLKYMPELTGQMLSWERLLSGASDLGVLLHELGHSKIMFERQTVKFLKSHYTAFKEMLSDVHGRIDTTRLPGSFASDALKRLILARSIALRRADIDDYLAEQDSAKKTILHAYAQAAEWMLNYHERNGSIAVNDDDGTINIRDWDLFARVDTKLLGAAYEAIANEQHYRGSIDRFVRLNSRRPRQYLPTNGHSVCQVSGFLPA